MGSLIIQTFYSSSLNVPRHPLTASTATRIINRAQFNPTLLALRAWCPMSKTSPLLRIFQSYFSWSCWVPCFRIMPVSQCILYSANVLHCKCKSSFMRHLKSFHTCFLSCLTDSFSSDSGASLMTLYYYYYALLL